MSTIDQYQDNRPPEEIADDVERTRAELGSTIDAIQRKLTPGQMMDQAFNYARTSLPADFGTNLGNAVRNNPLPVTLIGIGIAWLAASGQSGRYAARRTSAEYEGYYEGDYASGEGEGEGRMRRMASKASDTGHRIADKASELGHRISDSTSALTGRARGAGERMQSSAQYARDRAGQIGQRSQEQYHRARDGFSNMVEEQPLMLGVLGLALGAALGAAFPTTRREDELMGSKRDDLLHRAQEAGREQAEHLKESAKRVADTAKQEGERVASEASSRASQTSQANQASQASQATHASATETTRQEPATRPPGSLH